MRLGLSPVLCGDRNAFGAARWAQQIAAIRAGLAGSPPPPPSTASRSAMENHQDFGSAELMAFCEEAGDNVGITLDRGNAFPVAESPLSFARTVAPRVRHVHLKDYRVQFTDEGYRLVRCAIGDGAVPFREIFDLLLADGRTLTASLEPGALEARHVRLFTAGLVARLRARRTPARSPRRCGPPGSTCCRRTRTTARRGSAERRATS